MNKKAEEKGLVLNVSQYGLEASRAEQIENIFVPMVKMLHEFEGAYNEVIKEYEGGITPEITAKAKRLRLDIGRVRIDTEKVRKAEKEEYLRGGKAVDGVANILKFAVSTKEDRLKEIETHYERIETERIEKLQSDREIELEKYGVEEINIDLAIMSEEVWNNYLNSYRLEHEKKIEAEKKAEEDRIAEEKAEKAEQERIRKENELLKKQAVERDRLQKITDDKARKAIDAAEKKAKTEQAKRDAEEAERARLQKIEDDKKEKILAEERAEKARIQKELDDKKAEEKKLADDQIEAEKTEQAKRDAEEKSKRLAPDKEKLLSLAVVIEGIELPLVNDKTAQNILKEVRERLERTYSDLIEQAEKL